MGAGPTPGGSSGGSGGQSGDAANSFQVIIKTDVQKFSAKKFRKAAEAGTGKKLPGKVIPTSVPGGVDDSNTKPGGSLGNAKDKIKKNRLFFAGAEGFRVGDVRLSRTGFSLSEKTLVGAGKLGVVAAAGQVLGSVLTLGVQTRDDIRKGKTAGQIATNLLVRGPGKIITQVSELFGANKIGQAIVALFSGEDLDFVKEMSDRGRKRVFDYEGWQRDREDEQARQSSENAKAQIEFKSFLRATRINQYPQGILARTDFIREDIANNIAEDRLLVRDTDGRPLYKTLRVSMNGGQK